MEVVMVSNLVPVLLWLASQALGPAHHNRPAHRELVVDDDGAQCPGAAYSSLQAAVDAAKPGDRVTVCPGTYREQVRVDKPLRILAQGGAVLAPSGMVANATNAAGDKAIAAALLVDGAGPVVIEGLTVDASANGLSACRPVLVGVFFRNGSGRLSEVAVRGARLGAGLTGCQSGLGVLVESTAGAASDVEVLDSSIRGYQKNGVTALDAGTRLTARRNVVSGAGLAAAVAQNGLQIGPGARGVIEQNEVANHVWGGCSVDACAFVATDVLVIEAADVTVRRNTLGTSQTGVYLDRASGARIIDNRILDTLVGDGVLVVGDHNQVVANTITQADEAGVFLLGSDNFVFANRIQDAPVGVWKWDGSTGNVIGGNKFRNVVIPVLDPPGAAPASAPFRE
jgi:nitrous oxidase accessory protein NosD